MIDLSKYANEEVKNRVTGVGIELEGAWRTLPRGMVEVTRDGSLDIWTPPERHVHKGEIPSPVLKVGTQVKDWLRAYFPTYSNHPRCAMHVHLSVQDNFQYQALMCEDYMWTVIHYLKEFAKKENFPTEHWIWQRLNGDVEYCKPVFQADAQVRQRAKSWDHDIPGNRYTAINFPWGRFQTVECRLLPMMTDADQADRAVQCLVDITNKFLRATAKREKKQTVTITDDQGPEVRESVILI